MVSIALMVVLSPPGFSFHFLETNALYFMFLYLALGLGLYVVGRPQSMFVSFACCALLCYTLQERSACSLVRPEGGEGPRIKVAHFDLSGWSLSADSVLRAITEVDADIFSIQGLQAGYFARIHAALTSSSYANYQFSSTTPDPPGLVVYCKAPFSYVKRTGSAETSSILGRVQLDRRGALHFMSVYFSPARSAGTYAELQRQIQALGFQAYHIDAPLLVFGNYSLKPWSRAIQQYKTFSQLKNSRRGMQPTWPHGYLPILDDLSDHIFYSDHFKCLKFETISCGLNPHLGISATFEWIETDEQATDQKKNTEL